MQILQECPGFMLSYDLRQVFLGCLGESTQAAKSFYEFLPRFRPETGDIFEYGMALAFYFESRMVGHRKAMGLITNALQ